MCIATYNGAAYIEQQIRSILEQLLPGDEIIIVDDCSTDNTVMLLEQFRDARINLHRNERNRGHVFSFQAAIGMARNPVVLLSDQDDRWIAGRVQLMTEALLQSGAMVVSSNCKFMSADGAEMEYRMRRLRASDSRRFFANLINIFAGRANYYGCAMGFRRDLGSLILPMPFFVESHDLWIALASNLIRSNIHLDAETLVRRIHGGNLTTSRRSLFSKMRTRWNFLLSLIVLMGRYVLHPEIRMRLHGRSHL